MQKLPIGIQSFAKLRNDDCLYVDKTEVIHHLITSGTTFFLSRPRRFGKSLLVSTMEEIFKGKKSLFRGLWIEDNWDWTVTSPVIRIDFGGTSNRSPEALTNSLLGCVKAKAAEYKINLEMVNLSDRFKELIEKLHCSAEKQVVVLIDEYDKPIIDNLSNLDIADANRLVLHDFYQVMKAADEHLRFVFLTGVSKFSKVSIFSGLNNLIDITLEAQFATICGYTQAELESCFDPYIVELAQKHECSKQEAIEKIKYWYDGYSWDGETFVYNSFSTLMFFRQQVFKDHWFATGSPTFIVNILKEHNDIQALLEPIPMQAERFDSFDIRTINPRILMFQTGYLTIKKTQKNAFGELRYILGLPNEEVNRALTAHLFAAHAAIDVADVDTTRSDMMELLLDGDPKSFERNLQAMFARIPNQLWGKDEKYYHSMLLLWLNMLGFKVDAEVNTDKGRIDAVWTWQERVVVAEIKYTNARTTTTDALLDEALAQIRARRYYERYAGENKRIALLGVAFAGKEIACRMEELS
ncbi:ATP-binding protein [Candidatus Symbiothrix dinenymphae]|uniref:ATP-binding protein n=1 Tax=Candidatus Symbiothrix dinenymphae TaxID=467085 RepID=UPI0006BF2F27|nr:ATP-binding protein [Candidatus Symbiothrix dinenymphae]GAP73004.1 AAA ATPase [Candidatus Symbiothrix dinenymphae]